MMSMDFGGGAASSSSAFLSSGGYGPGLEVAGPIPPWTLHRLMRVLQEEVMRGGGQPSSSGGGEVHLHMESDPSALSLSCSSFSSSAADSTRGGEGLSREEARNVKTLWTGDGEGGREGGGAAWTVEEAMAICDPSPYLARRIVKAAGIKEGDGGTIVLKLS